MTDNFDSMFGIYNGVAHPMNPVVMPASSMAPVPPEVPQLRAAAPAPKDDPGFFQNYGWRGVVGGVSAAASGVLSTFNDASAATEGAIDKGIQATLGITPKRLIMSPDGKLSWGTFEQGQQARLQIEGDLHKDRLSVLPDPVGVGAKITKNVVEFSASFVPMARAVEAVEWTSKFTKGAALVAAGATSAFASSDPMAGNLANVAASVGIDKSAFAQELHITDLVDALKVSETDGAITARLKNAAVDGVIGQVAMDGALKFLGKGVAVVREASKAKMAVEAAAAAEATKVPTETFAADIATHADDAVAAMKGEPSTAEKAAQAAAEDTGVGAQAGDKITMPEEPTATPAGGAERIGPQLEDAMAQMHPDDLKSLAQDFEDGRYFEALERTGVNPARIDFGKFLASFADQDAAKAGLQDMMLRAAKAAEPISEYFGSKTLAGQAPAMFSELTGQSPADVVQALNGKTQNLNTYFHVAAGLIAGETQKLYALALKAKPFASLDGNSPEVLALMKQWQTLTTLQGAFRGSASNVGRGLRALQDVAAANESASGTQLANSILGKTQVDAVTDRLNKITEALGGNMTPKQRAAFIKQIVDTKGDVVKVAKNAISNDGSLTTAGFRALRETSANLFGISTFTNVAASITGYIASEVVANQLVHPIAMLTRNREWVAASAAAKAQLSAFGPALASGLAHGLQLVTTDALHEVGNALDGTGISALRQTTDGLAEKADAALAKLPTGSEKLGKDAQGPLRDKYMREGITRDADWYIAPQTIRDMADFPNHGPAFWQSATRSILGMASGSIGAISNTFGAASRFGRTITVDLADNIAGNTMYAATRWSEAVRTATKVGIDRGLYGEELGKFSQDEAKRLVAQTSGDTQRALQNLVQAGSSDMDTLKSLAQDYLDRNGIESIAEDTARRMLFQDDLKWGLSEKLRKTMYGADPGGIIVPFVKTPLRIIETGIQDFSPLGLLFKSTREQLLSGGPDSVTTAAKMLMGTSLLLEGYNGAAAGTIVGYDGGPKASSRLERPSYSQKIGDKWVDFSRFDPLSFTLGAGADLYQFEQAERLRNENSVDPSSELQQLAHAFLMTAVQGVLSKSWLTSLNNWAKLADANTADAGWNGILDGLTQRFVPMGGLQKAIEQEGTGHVKQTRDLWDKYRQSWAVASDTLPDKRDSVLGEPVTYDRVAGFRVAGHEDDPVKRELGKLAFQLPPDVKSINGVQLTADQVEKLKELQGKADLGGGTIRDRLADLFKSPDYQDLTQAQKVEAVQQYRGLAASIAKEQLLGSDKDLRARVMTQQMVKTWQQIGVAPEAMPAKIAAFKKELMSQ